MKFFNVIVRAINICQIVIYLIRISKRIKIDQHKIKERSTNWMNYCD